MNTNATAQMVTTTQVGCTRTNWRKLYEELIQLHTDAVNKCNEARAQLAKTERMLDLAGAQNMGIDNLAKLDSLVELLRKIQPFAKAWAMEDLCDEIEDAIKPRPPKSP